MSDREDLVRAAVERLCEDEALRGNLSDSGFGLLLDWGIAAVQAFDASASDAAFEKYAHRVRKVIRAAVAAAEAGKVEDPQQFVNHPTDPKDPATRRLAALRLGEDADANAEQLAAFLQATWKPIPAGRRNKP